MQVDIPNLMPVLPEMFLLGMACLILVIDLFLSDANRRISYYLTLGTLAGAALLSWHLIGQPRTLTFDDMFVLDGMASVLKLVAYLAVAMILVYSKDYLQDRDLFKGEFFTLSLLALLGIMVMISAYHFLTIYLGLELLSLSLYAMVALNRDSGVASEAAIKYFVLGAIASGILLYGMSIIYGVTGTLAIAEVSQSVAAGDVNGVGMVMGLTFVVVGLCFKLGAVPFHMWIPDVYHGSPTPVSLFVGSAPKIAAFAMFMRLLVEGLGGMHADWQGLLIVVSILSMAIGSIVAIAQTNIKRLMAYSTINHVGFILLGILAGTPEGYQAAMYYTIVYVLMTTAGFGMILLLSRKGFEAERIDDFKGLNDRSPWYAAMMMFVMFGMAGVPPFIGFYAKLEVLFAVVGAGLSWLAVLAVLFSVIAAFYYLRVVKVMYFDNPEDSSPVQANAGMHIVLSANSLALLVLGVVPGFLMAVCARVLAG